MFNGVSYPAKIMASPFKRASVLYGSANWGLDDDVFKNRVPPFLCVWAQLIIAMALEYMDIFKVNILTKLYHCFTIIIVVLISYKGISTSVDWMYDNSMQEIKIDVIRRGKFLNSNLAMH